MYDVIVIGGGIAGLTSSIYIKRGLKNVLLLEGYTIGGEIVKSQKIENYPGYESISGSDLMTTIYNQAVNLGVEVKNEKVIEIDGEDNNFTITTNENKYTSKKVIIATGTKSGVLDINEDKYVGRGVSTCATCDANFFKGRDVAVVGGGNSAVEDALYLSNIVNKVYLIHRNNELKANMSTIESLKEKDNVEFLLNTNVKKIIGDNVIEKIIIDTNNEERELNISGLFICVGRVPISNMFNVDKDEKGYIITNEDMETSIKGIYAIGDVRNKNIRQLTTAAGDGTVCVINILKDL